MKDSRLIILKEKGKILSLLFTKGRLVEVSACDAPSAGTRAHGAEAEGASCEGMTEDAAGGRAAGQRDCPLGSIYVGKVLHVVANIDAAFVELEKGEKGFLPLRHGKTAGPLNRQPDGRILAGDEILVQVEREAVKTKEPVLTTELSLSGRYAVVVMKEGGGRLDFSGKLPVKTKKALAEALEERGIHSDILPSCSVIVRTNAGELEDPDILAGEIRMLSERMGRIASVADSRICHSCLYRPESRWLTEVRDTYVSQYEEIVTDDRELYEELRRYLASGYPEELGRLRFYGEERVSLRNLYGIGAKLEEALGKRVWLRSGGYLVIEPTEALTVVDVNSGKHSGKKGSRETFCLINREAAAEIARQLRLRNLSGIILVDFINMETEEEERELLSFLAAELKRDPVKASVVDMTPLGLVEITRKKIRKSLREQLGRV